MCLRPTCGAHCDGFGREAQCGEGKRGDRIQRLAHRHDAILAITRHRPRTADRIGDRDARLIALRRKPSQEIACEHRLAAEQMRAAGDVQQQPIRRIEPDQRRVAVAPVGDRFEQLPIRMLVRIRDRDLRVHRTRIGERHAHLEAERGRGVVHGGEPQRALDGAGDDQRFRR